MVQNKGHDASTTTRTKYLPQSVLHSVLSKHVYIATYIDDRVEAFLLLYVDDALVSGTIATVTQIQKKMEQHFECKFNIPKDFLGMDIATRTKGETSLSMITFTNKLIKTFEIKRWPYPITTPGRTDIKIQKDEDPENVTTYRSKVGTWTQLALYVSAV